MFYNYHTGITLDLQVGKKKIISNIKRKNVIIGQKIPLKRNKKEEEN